MWAGVKEKWPWVAAGVVWCLALAMALSWNRMLSASVDSSYHLQVMEVVKHALIIPQKGHEFMAEMFIYPKLSHRLAALADLLGWKRLNALMLVGCLSAAATWLLLFGQARRVSLLLLGSSAVLAVINVYVTRATFGGELVDNFFYPQVVGEAVCLMSLVAGAGILARSRAWFGVFATLAVLFCGCFHLVPTLKLAGAFMALVGVAGLRDLLQYRRLDWIGLAALVAIPAAVLLSPFFWRMRWMAANNGSVNFASHMSMRELILGGLFLVGMSAWILVVELRKPADEADTGRRATTLLAALGAATGLSLLAQYAAFKLAGDGSVYAILKHAFGVFGMLGFVAPLWLLTVLGDRVPPLPGETRRLGIALTFVAQTVLVLCLFLRPSVFDVARVNAILKDVREVRLTRGLHGEDVVFSASNMPPITTYMGTIAMLQSPHGGNVLALMATGRPNRPGDVPYVVTLVGDAYDKPGCRVGAPIGQVVVMRGPCIEPPSLAFKAGGSGVPYLRDGWTGPEAGGVWSNGPRATVDMPISPAQRTLPEARLEIAAFAFLPDVSPARTVTVSVPGSAPVTFKFDRQVAIRHDYVLPLSPEALRGETLKVTFDIHDPKTPSSLGLGDDPRALGVGLEAIRIVSAQALEAKTQ